ncbi:MAG: aminopeptidase P family N-terminal domain-containing protein, partial [Planctomycetales bacterium]|nr:aminopeptidase P family N-terminal domain-containing protein [Planctomycetales bacterium]
MTVFAIDVQACRGRQRRLLESMQESGIDHAVLTRTEHVQYLAGPRFPWALVPICVLAADGTATLIAPHKEPETSAADQVAWYDAKWHSTMRNDQLSAAAACLF